MDFIKQEIKPIDFEPVLMEDYIQSIDSELATRSFRDTMDYLHEEMSEKREKKTVRYAITH